MKTLRKDVLFFRVLADGQVVVEAEGAVAVVAGELVVFLVAGCFFLFFFFVVVVVVFFVSVREEEVVVVVVVAAAGGRGRGGGWAVERDDGAVLEADAFAVGGWLFEGVQRGAEEEETEEDGKKGRCRCWAAHC